MLKKIFKYFLLFVITIFFVVIILLSLVLYTEQGTKLFLNKTLPSVVNNLHIEDIQGRLGTTTKIKKISYTNKDDGVTLSANDLNFAIEPLKLLYLNVAINLQANDLKLEITNTEEEQILRLQSNIKQPEKEQLAQDKIAKEKTTSTEPSKDNSKGNLVSKGIHLFTYNINHVILNNGHIKVNQQNFDFRRLSVEQLTYNETRYKFALRNIILNNANSSIVFNNKLTQQELKQDQELGEKAQELNKDSLEQEKNTLKFYHFLDNNQKIFATPLKDYLAKLEKFFTKADSRLQGSISNFNINNSEFNFVHYQDNKAVKEKISISNLKLYYNANNTNVFTYLISDSNKLNANLLLNANFLTKNISLQADLDYHNISFLKGIPNINGKLEIQGNYQQELQGKVNLFNNNIVINKTGVNFYNPEEAKKLKLQQVTNTSLANSKFKVQSKYSANENSKENSQSDLILRLNANAAYWPLELNLTNNGYTTFYINNQTFKIQNLNLSAKGDLINLATKIDGTLMGQNITNKLDLNNLHVAGNVDFKEKEISSTLKLSNLRNSSLETKTLININPHVVYWDVAANTENFIYNLPHHNVENKLQLKQSKFNTSGSAYLDGDLQLSLNDVNIKGTYNNEEINITNEFSDLELLDKLYANVKELNIQLGKNKIQINGDISEHSNLSVKTKTTDLNNFIPNLIVVSNNDFIVKGNYLQPYFKGNINIDSLEFLNFKIKKLKVNGDLDIAAEQQSNLIVNAKELNINQINLHDLKLNISGNLYEHNIEQEVTHELFKNKFHIRGKFDEKNKVYSANIENKDLHITNIGKINFKKDINLSYDFKAKQVNFKNNCLDNEHFNLCFQDGYYNNQSILLKGKVEEINLEFFNQYLLKQAIEISSLYSGDFSVVQKKGQKDPEVKLALTTSILKVTNLNSYINNTIVANNELKFVMKDKKAVLDTNLQIITDKVDEENTTKLHIVIPDISNSKVINSSISIQKLNLNSILNSNIKNEGALNAELEIKDILNQSSLTGYLDLQDVDLEYSLIPFTVKKSNLHAKVKENQIDIKGTINTDSKPISLSGNINWINLKDITSQLSLYSKDIILRHKEFGDLTTDLNLELNAHQEKVNISGNIDINNANINIKQINSSIKNVPDDVVFISNNNEINQSNKNLITVDSNIEINLNKNIHLKAYGIDTNLVGKLTVHQNNNTLGLYGNINLENGTFLSYGQSLIIEHGKISFSGISSQPIINLRAIRSKNNTNDNVLVGLNVVGSISNQQVTLFSEPSLPANQQLSYLLTGAQLNNNKDNTSLGLSLITNSLTETSNIISEIGNKFGINNLHITTLKSGNETQLSVIGTILNGLQISYGIGLFNANQEFTATLDVTQGMYIQFVKNISTSIDLIYKFFW